MNTEPHSPHALFQSPAAPQELHFGSGNIEAMHDTCEAIGQVIESWGFKKVMGMIWAFLYLCPEPASAKDICQALHISPALASMTLQDLIRWGVVKKLSPLGQRRDYYVAEHDVWKMIKKVLQERERKHISEVAEKLEHALAALKREEASSLELKSHRTCQFQAIRIEDLLGVTRAAETLLNSFLHQGRLDMSPLFSLLKPYQQLAKSMKFK